MEVVLVHIILAVVLFYLVNWLGRHSYALGYVEISVFMTTEDAPAMNYLFRVLAPVVYLVVVSTAMLAAGVGRLVDNVYCVSAYYIAIRVAHNILHNRLLLINWVRAIVYYASIMLASYAVYKYFIIKKYDMLPDINSISNEIWLIIAIYLYQLINGLDLSASGLEKRKSRYIRSRLRYFVKRHGEVVTQVVKTNDLRNLVYAVMLYEDFNRPRVVRLVEYVYHVITRRPITSGIMQVMSTNYLTDDESVMRGASKISEAYHRHLSLKDGKEHDGLTDELCYSILKEYNLDDSYTYEVCQLYEYVASIQTVKEENHPSCC